MKIKVTQAHVNEAIRKNSHHCMIAEAIKEQVSGAQQILVDVQSIRWTDSRLGVRYFYFTPPQAQKALLQFDQGEKVDSFDLELRKPTMVRPMGISGEGQPYPTHEEKRTRKKVAPRNRVVKRMSVERQFGVRQLVVEEEGER